MDPSAAYLIAFGLIGIAAAIIGFMVILLRKKG